MEDYIIEFVPMKSASDEQAKPVYKKIIGKTNIWYIGVQENEGDVIYTTSKSGEHSDGYGGRTLTFKLDDGTIDDVQGPWHSNNVSLFKDTGYDVSQKYFTFGCISLGKTYEKDSHRAILTDVIYKDDDFVLGDFSRVKLLAEKFAKERNCKIYYYSQGLGGSTTSWID